MRYTTGLYEIRERNYFVATHVAFVDLNTPMSSLFFKLQEKVESLKVIYTSAL